MTRKEAEELLNCKNKSCENCEHVYMEYDEETETWIYYCTNPKSKYYQCVI